MSKLDLTAELDEYIEEYNIYIDKEYTLEDFYVEFDSNRKLRNYVDKFLVTDYYNILNCINFATFKKSDIYKSFKWISPLTPETMLDYITTYFVKTLKEKDYRLSSTGQEITTTCNYRNIIHSLNKVDYCFIGKIDLIKSIY